MRSKEPRDQRKNWKASKLATNKLTHTPNKPTKAFDHRSAHDIKVTSVSCPAPARDGCQKSVAVGCFAVPMRYLQLQNSASWETGKPRVLDSSNRQVHMHGPCMLHAVQLKHVWLLHWIFLTLYRWHPLATFQGGTWLFGASRYSLFHLWLWPAVPWSPAWLPSVVTAARVEGIDDVGPHGQCMDAALKGNPRVYDQLMIGMIYFGIRGVPGCFGQ